MNRSRKSKFGTGTLGLPVRLDMSMYQNKRSPGFGRRTPSPNLLSRRATLHFGTAGRTGITPIRPSDLSPRDASVLFSMKKVANGKTPQSTSKARRCLYQNKVENNEASSSQHVASSQPVARGLRKPGPVSVKSNIPPSVKSRIPSLVKSRIPSASGRPATSREPLPAPDKPVRVSKTNRATTSGQTTEQAHVLNDLRQVLQQQQDALQEHQNIIQEGRVILEEIKSMKSVVEEQKSMIFEAKGAFSQILEEQRLILDEQKKILDEARAISVEKAKPVITVSPEANIQDDKENITDRRKSDHHKSEVAYRQMRRSFRCLGTPTLTCSTKKSKTPQIRTPRTSLSNRVRAQLQNLLDDPTE